MANTTKNLSAVDKTASSDVSSANMLCVSNGNVKQLPGYIQQIDKNKNDIASMMLKIYPVGAIYISASATNPGTLFGGTWEQIKGRFLVAVGALEENNNTWFGTVEAGAVNCPAGEKGGEAWHTLTVNQMPSHDHRDMRWGGSSGNENGYFGVNAGSETSGRQATWYFNYASGAAQAYFKTGFSGGNAAHNNMPPYLAVYMWKRTA